MKAVYNMTIKDVKPPSFNDLWALCPKDRGRVNVFDKITKQYTMTQIFRKYLTYGKVPKFDKTTGKSYMYNGVQDTIPAPIQHYWDRAELIDKRVNSLIVNWYEKEDYIQPHRDCSAAMVDNYNILIFMFDEGPTPRGLDMHHLNGDFSHNLKPQPKHNPLVLDKSLNEGFRHSVGKGTSRRVSLTFRAYKDELCQS